MRKCTRRKTRPVSLDMICLQTQCGPAGLPTSVSSDDDAFANSVKDDCPLLSIHATPPPPGPTTALVALVASWDAAGLLGRKEKIKIKKTYGAVGGLLVAVFAVDLEGDVVGSVALDLERAGGQVVEVAVQQLKSNIKKNVVSQLHHRLVFFCKCLRRIRVAIARLHVQCPDPSQKGGIWAGITGN